MKLIIQTYLLFNKNNQYFDIHNKMKNTYYLKRSVCKLGSNYCTFNMFTNDFSININCILNRYNIKINILLYKKHIQYVLIGVYKTYDITIIETKIKLFKFDMNQI